MSEQELVIRARDGDSEAFCQLYGLHKDKMYRYAYYRLGNSSDAEDAVSDCVVSAFSQISKLKNTAAFSTWIFRILYCSCTDYIKSQIRQKGTANLEDYPSLSTDTPTTQNTELQEALATLKDEEREIVLLSVIAGYTSNEIASVTGMTAGSVRSKQSRSLAKLRTFLDKE